MGNELNNNKIKILVACHKADPAIRHNDIYMPIQVGKALHSELDLGFQGDDTGNNISEKNGSYCELTAMYWAWKNLPKDVDIVGLAHYRRYLQIDLKCVEHLLNRYDVVIPFPKMLPWSVEKELALWTSIEDVYILIDILRQRFKEQRDLIDQYIFKSNRFYRYNMFLMSRSDFNDYCSFLFDVLSEFESISMPYIHNRQKRIIGYIGETLLGLWIKLRKKKTFNVGVDGTEDGSFRQRLAYIRNLVSFGISGPRRVIVDNPVIIGLKQDGYTLDTF